MIRKALREKLEREARLELEKNLQRCTEQEIKEEIAVVKNILEAKDAWKTYKDTGDIPELVCPDYKMIFDCNHSKEEYEPELSIRTEMVALSLTDHLCSPLVARDAYGHREEIWAWLFVRVAISYQKGIGTWRNVDYAYQPIKSVSGNKERLIETVGRLLERLAEIQAYANDADNLENLLRPLSLLFHSDARSTLLREKVQNLINDQWLDELCGSVDAAMKRLEVAMQNLPNPNNISCEDAMRRVIGLYESDIGSLVTWAQTLEDATIIDHVETCYEKCHVLEGCVSSVFGHQIVRQWSDRPDDYTANAIKAAKAKLAA